MKAMPLLFQKANFPLNTSLQRGLKIILLIFLSITLPACQTSHKLPEDRNLWLENIENEKALHWVKEKNKSTMDELKKDKRFKGLEKQMLEILTASDRMPLGQYWGGYVYNFWQDKKNVRGIWRRTPLQSYKTHNPKWETIIDVDKLAKKENENWVFKWYGCLPPEYEHCMIRLSRGGKDASVLREFNLKSKKFVKEGFFVPEAKSNYTWYDKDHLLVSTDFGKETLTESGYPRMIKLWKRGTDLASSKTLLTVGKKDIEVDAFVIQLNKKTRHTFLVQQMSFYTMKVFYLKENLELLELPLPESIEFQAATENQILFSLRKEWRSWKPGDLLSFSINDFLDDERIETFHTVYQPNERSTINSISSTKNGVYVNTMENVVSHVKYYTFNDNAWSFKSVPLPDKGTIHTISANRFVDEALFSFESFTTPRSLYLVKNAGSQPIKIKSQPEKFNGSEFVTQQFLATSKDGTKVPYFVVHKKNLTFNGNHPVLQYGYGGFEISMRPYNSATVGKGWLEAGGIYVMTNIRGGGEFGPKWHQAALKTNRQKAFDDFIAVSEDLIARKITSPSKLSIMGGSNGGLLVGAVMVQRPELYAGVVCQVPLLDMARYHKLLAGASWEAEYGSVENTNERKAILSYSPYQNLKKDVQYPKALFITSTKDDRVHPGHARKMVKKMNDLGHKVFYFENIEGGHSAAANRIQRAQQKTVEFIYLYNQLNM